VQVASICKLELIVLRVPKIVYVRHRLESVHRGHAAHQ
jgi:hypothetical protein